MYPCASRHAARHITQNRNRYPATSSNDRREAVPPPRDNPEP
ncbi:MAG: hypothetical protein IPN56_14370 [Chitinophagaceae bacterium]|nr:hypothetical protein [Chitinophagaceae bacterium]MBK9661487.1 hypothetical protein [Chitinophagaceae bacterium]